MSRNFLPLLFSFFLIFASCGSGDKNQGSEKKSGPEEPLSGTISVGGAFALYPIMQSWADSFMAIHPDVKIKITTAGSGQGISGLSEGKFDLAMISFPAEDSDTSAAINYIQVSQDAVVPVFNINNPNYAVLEKKGLTPKQFQDIFLSGESITWGDILDNNSKEVVKVYTRSDISGAAEIWGGFLYARQSDLKGIQCNGEDEMISKIQSDPLAVGYTNLINAYDIKTKAPKEGIAVIPIDIDFDRKVDFKDIKQLGLEEFHRNVWLGKYPKTLCRKLSIAVHKDKMDQLKHSFLLYILKEGQKNVDTVGYCPLNNVQLQSSISILGKNDF